MFGETLLDYLGDLSPPSPKASFFGKGSDEIPDRAQWEDGEMEV